MPRNVLLRDAVLALGVAAFTLVPGAGRLGAAIRIQVTTDGPAGTGKPGHGLIGLTERVGVYGGELRAGPRADGTFEVHAVIPRASA